MTCKSCPDVKYCGNKGNCENCKFGKVFVSYNLKIQKLKAKNSVLRAENKELKNRLDIILNDDF